MIISRRGILRGLFAAPAIIAADRLMPVRAWARDPAFEVMWNFAEGIYWPTLPMGPLESLESFGLNRVVLQSGDILRVQQTLTLT
jgi:hypothetical protein